jgi:hypothetical protein
MKKLVLIGALFLSAMANAQNVPNGGFENWTTQGTYEDPNNWLTLNLFTMFGGPATTTKSTDMHSGLYAAKCETIITELDQDGEDEVFPGTMTLGIIDMNAEETYSGMAMTTRPDSLIAWIKYQATGADMFGVSVTMSRWDSGDAATEIMGTGTYSGGTTVGGYTRIAVPITYGVAGIPDTAQIIFASSAGEPGNGSSLWVDDLSYVINSTAAAPEHKAAMEITYYPNPANHALTVVSPKNTTIRVYNTLGMLIETIKVNTAEKATIQTSEYRNGVYLLKTDSGELERFVVQH